MARGQIRIDLLNEDHVIKSLEGLLPQARTLALTVTRQATDHVRNHMVEGIAKGPKTGRIYRGRFPYVFGQDFIPPGYRRAKPHQASAEGEYPAADTGNLMRSIYTEIEDMLEGLDVNSMEAQLQFSWSELAAAESSIHGIIGVDAEYAAPLEYKPPERGGRPFATRALGESEDAIRTIFWTGMAGKFGGAGA